MLLVNLQMFEILQPGCGGVLTIETVEKLTLDQFKAAEEFTMKLMEGEAASYREESESVES